MYPCIVSFTAINTASACHTKNASSESCQMSTLFTFLPILNCGFLVCLLSAAVVSHQPQGWVSSTAVQTFSSLPGCKKGMPFFLSQVAFGLSILKMKIEVNLSIKKPGCQPDSIEQVSSLVFSPPAPTPPFLHEQSLEVTHVII